MDYCDHPSAPAGFDSLLPLGSLKRLTLRFVSQLSEEAILRIERPDRRLWTYYVLSALAFPPAFPFVVLPLYFRYQTMRYRFTDEGISMRWGILFRREIIIQYARIQDIHLRSNVVERWLGLAKVLIQTASGNATAEMTLEGLREFEAVRDFLYSRMRGVQEVSNGTASVHSASAGSEQGGVELASVLSEVTHELRELRLTLERRQQSPDTHV